LRQILSEHEAPGTKQFRALCELVTGCGGLQGHRHGLAQTRAAEQSTCRLFVLNPLKIPQFTQ
jgi:hypothetical protein